MKNKINVSAAVQYARSKYFGPDARVAGILVNADIGPVSYGELYGGEEVRDGQFIRFEAIGLDWRNGYDLVRSNKGKAYVIVTYAEHARSRGLSFLIKHMTCCNTNREWYANQLAITWGLKEDKCF